jgi:hypothetical protein
MAGSYIDDRIWAVAGIDWNPDSAIGRYWRQLRSEGNPIGLPVTPEIETPVGIQQGFSSGYTIVWNSDDGASLANDP